MIFTQNFSFNLIDLRYAKNDSLSSKLYFNYA